MADYERDSQIGTTISQVQRVLTENPTQREQAEAVLISQIGAMNESDPNAVYLLNEVLESLKFKNLKAQ